MPRIGHTEGRPIRNGPVIHNRYLTAAEVCATLGVSHSWLSRHRDLLTWFRIPGRGAKGEEYRYTLESVERYVQSRITNAREDRNPFAGKTIRQITELIKAGAN